MANHRLHHCIGQNATTGGQTAARHVTDSGQRVFKTSQQTVSGTQQLYTINQSINQSTVIISALCTTECRIS